MKKTRWTNRHRQMPKFPHIGVGKERKNKTSYPVEVSQCGPTPRVGRAQKKMDTPIPSRLQPMCRCAAILFSPMRCLVLDVPPKSMIQCFSNDETRTLGFSPSSCYHSVARCARLIPMRNHCKTIAALAGTDLDQKRRVSKTHTHTRR